MSNSPIAVTVTGAGSLIGQAVIKSLRHENSGRTYSIQGLDYFPHAFGFRWCDATGILPDILSPEVSGDEWFDSLCTQVQNHRSRFVFFGVDFELIPAADRRMSMIERTGARPVVSASGIVSRCRDKLATAELLAELGFAVPISLASSVCFDEAAATLGLPFLLKPRVGSRSRGHVLIYKATQLETALRDSHKAVMLQEHLPEADTEYTVGVSVHDSLVDTVCVLRRTLRDGNTDFAESDGNPVVTDYCHDIARALSPEGPINIQLRLQNDVPKAFEINPRFSGTTYFRTLLGVNQPARFIAHCEDLPLPSSSNMAAGAVRRFFDEMLVEPAN